MKKWIVGIDTSCYYTSLSVIDTHGSVRINNRLALPVKLGSLGIRQNDAVFHHVQNLASLSSGCLAGLDPLLAAAVGVSVKPEDRVNSYMPVFKVGEAFGKTIASVLRVPLFEFTHQQGHVTAAKLNCGMDAERFIVFHISGGTTESLLYDKGKLHILGCTKDISAGQLIDRAGVRLGLSFPSGPEMEALAVSGVSLSAIPVSKTSDELDCHFSGAENQIIKWVETNKCKNDIAAEVFDVISRTLVKMINTAVNAAGCANVLLVGGVASSVLLRKTLLSSFTGRQDVHLFFGLPEYSSDNALGVALLALQQLMNGECVYGCSNH